MTNKGKALAFVDADVDDFVGVFIEHISKSNRGQQVEQTLMSNLEYMVRMMVGGK